MSKRILEAGSMRQATAAAFILLLILLMWPCPPALSEDSAGASTDDKKEIHEKPLWEVNLLVGGIRLPHYRGSNEYETYVLPLPYPIYRGKVFQIDREGVYSVFPFTEHLELTLSGYANPPVPDDSEARQGMEELDPIIELGPSLKWYFTDRAARERLYLQGSVRAAVSVGLPDNLRSEYQGIHAELACIYENRYLVRSTEWEMGAALGIDFTDADYNSYFYEVSKADARSGRPAYKANGGYAGFKLSGSLSKKISDRLTALVYGRWENSSAAVFQNSPLVDTKNNFSVGAALIWHIFSSEQKVDF